MRIAWSGAIPTFADRLCDSLTRFGKERRGVAALEFAILLPMMLILFLGSVEMSTGVMIKRKVTLTAQALANLSSQFTGIASSDMTNILNASSDIIVPYTAAQLHSVV